MLFTTLNTKTYNLDKEIGVIKNIYANNSILPSYTEAETNGNIRKALIFNEYTSRGKIIQFTTLDGISHTYIWSYCGQYPIAEIKNASYSEVKTALGWDAIRLIIYLKK